jgi:hypothetical protein
LLWQKILVFHNRGKEIMYRLSRVILAVAFGVLFGLLFSELGASYEVGLVIACVVAGAVWESLRGIFK